MQVRVHIHNVRTASLSQTLSHTLPPFNISTTFQYCCLLFAFLRQCKGTATFTDFPHLLLPTWPRHLFYSTISPPHVTLGVVLCHYNHTHTHTHACTHTHTLTPTHTHTHTHTLTHSHTHTHTHTHTYTHTSGQTDSLFHPPQGSMWRQWSTRGPC